MMDILQRLSSDNPAPYIDEALDEIRRLRFELATTSASDSVNLQMAVEMTAERDRLRELLTNVGQFVGEIDECLCMDPPSWNNEDESKQDEDNPSCHSQYCPHYIRAYIEAALSGESLPE